MFKGIIFFKKRKGSYIKRGGGRGREEGISVSVYSVYVYI